MQRSYNLADVDRYVGKINQLQSGAANNAGKSGKKTINRNMIMAQSVNFTSQTMADELLRQSNLFGNEPKVSSRKVKKIEGVAPSTPVKEERKCCAHCGQGAIEQFDSSLGESDHDQ